MSLRYLASSSLLALALAGCQQSSSNETPLDSTYPAGQNDQPSEIERKSVRAFYTHANEVNNIDHREIFERELIDSGVQRAQIVAYESWNQLELLTEQEFVQERERIDRLVTEFCNELGLRTPDFTYHRTPEEITDNSNQVLVVSTYERHANASYQTDSRGLAMLSTTNSGRGESRRNFRFTPDGSVESTLQIPIHMAAHSSPAHRVTTPLAEALHYLMAEQTRQRIEQDPTGTEHERVARAIAYEEGVVHATVIRYMQERSSDLGLSEQDIEGYRQILDGIPDYAQVSPMLEQTGQLPWQEVYFSLVSD